LRPSLRTSCKLICVAFVGIAISGCASAPAGTLAQVCGPNGWREIGVRKADVITPDTAKEIIGNNEARQAWCTPKKV
jgi:hypothetical protein